MSVTFDMGFIFFRLVKMLLVLISVVLNSTVARWGSRSSPSETGMTFSLLLNYASSHMGVKSDRYASGITQLAEREP